MMRADSAAAAPTAAVAATVAATAAAATAAAAAAAAAAEQLKVKCGLLLDVVVRKYTVILKLIAREGQPLLARRNSFLVLDLGLDIVDSIRCLDVQGNGLAGESFHEDLHVLVDNYYDFKYTFNKQLKTKWRKMHVEVIICAPQGTCGRRSVAAGPDDGLPCQLMMGYDDDNGKYNITTMEDDGCLK